MRNVQILLLINGLKLQSKRFHKGHKYEKWLHCVVLLDLISGVPQARIPLYWCCITACADILVFPGAETPSLVMYYSRWVYWCFQGQNPSSVMYYSMFVLGVLRGRTPLQLCIIIQCAFLVFWRAEPLFSYVLFNVLSRHSQRHNPASVMYYSRCFLGVLKGTTPLQLCII